MPSRRTSPILTGTIAALLAVGTAVSSHAVTWIGGTNTDWNEPSNWDNNTVPTAPADAVVNSTPANIATISANVPQPTDVRVGESNDTVIGTLFHTAGLLQAGSGNWSAIGAGATATGIYNLTGNTAAPGTLSGYTQGSGDFLTNSRLYVGGTEDGTYSAGGTATMNVNTTGSIRVEGFDSRLYVGARGSTGVLNLQNGTINAAGNQVLIGYGGTGTVNVSGGSLTATVRNENGDIIGDRSRIYVGNTASVDGATRLGTGFLNVSGGTVTSGSDLIIGLNGSTGTVNQTGGTINAGGWAYVGAAYDGTGNTGFLNISGGTFNKGGGRMYVGVGNGSTNADTTGHMTVSGNGVYNGTEFLVIGQGDTTSTLDVTGSGTINSGGLAVGGNPYEDAGRGNGTMTVNGTGALVNLTGELQVGRRGGSVGTFTLANGTVQTGGVAIFGAFGGTGNATVTGGLLKSNIDLWVGNGTVNFQGTEFQGNGNLTVSGGKVSAGTWLGVGRDGANGVLTINGNAVVEQGVNDMSADQSSRLELTNGGRSTNATVNLDGGTLLTNGIVNNGNSATTTSNTVFNFNGGLLVPRLANNGFLQGLTAANVKAGGARIDTNGVIITINQGLLADPTSTGGGLVKTGLGTLALGGVNTYTGPTVVNGGRLTLNQGSSIASSSSITVNGGRGITTSALVPGVTLIGNVLTIEDNGNSGGNPTGALPVFLNGGSLEYHGGSGVGGLVATVNVGSAANVAAQPQGGGGSLVINNFNTNQAATSTTTFISTYGALGSGGPNSSDVGHIILNNVNGVATDAVVAAHNGILGGWATALSNAQGGGDPTTHFATSGPNGITAVTYNGNTVAAGAATDNIQTSGDQFVGSNTTINALESAGSNLGISGGAALVLDSGGLLFNGTSHSISGDGTSAGTLTAGAIGGYKLFATANDTTSLYTVQDVAITNNGANAVTLVKGGLGQLTVASNSTYTGETVVNSGILEVSGSISGSSAVRVNSGATLVLSGSGNRLGNSAPVFLNDGATLNASGTDEGPVNGAAGATAAGIGTLNLAGNTTIDFGLDANAEGASLLFAGLNYTGGKVSLLNWTGTIGSDNRSAFNDRLLFFTNPNLSSSQLANFQFFDDTGLALVSGASVIPYNGYFELVAVPEPATAMSLLGGAALLLGVRRRKVVAV